MGSGHTVKFCEVKSGINVTGDKHSAEQLQMIMVINSQERSLCAWERDWIHIWNVCVLRVYMNIKYINAQKQRNLIKVYMCI